MAGEPPHRRLVFARVGHTKPQLPQLSASLARLVQVVPQIVPPGHTDEHMPGGVVASQKVPTVHVELPAAQLSVASTHVSEPLHAMPSAQFRMPPLTHVPDMQRSEIVQYARSSQVVPSARLDHDVVDDRGVQTRQPLMLPGA